MRNEKQKIRINDIFYNIVKDKKLIALLTLLGLVAGVVLSALGYIRGEMTKQYKITASVAISAQTESGAFSSRFKTPTREDFTLSQEMTDAAMYVISGDGTLSAVIESLDLVGVSAKSIKDNLTLTQYNTTQIIELSLMWRSEKEGIRILQGITDVSDDILLNTLKVGKLTTINAPSASYIFGGNIKMTTLIYATIAGLMIGILISVIKLLATPKLLRPADMENLFGIELLGTIPYNGRYTDADPFSLLPDNVNRELKSTANILMNRLEQAGKNRVYVTSAMRKEGKTRMAADLAVKISESGKKVLLVDCDFTNPTLSSLFGISSPSYSLNDVYNGDCDRTDAIIQLSGCLYLLPAVLDNKAELMGDTMMNLLDGIFKDYDFVFVDTDSIGENPEIIRLNKAVDAAVFVAEFDSTNLSEIRSALLQISKSGLPTAGCVVNASKTWRDMLRSIEKLAKTATKKIDKRRVRKPKAAKPKPAEKEKENK